MARQPAVDVAVTGASSVCLLFAQARCTLLAPAAARCRGPRWPCSWLAARSRTGAGGQSVYLLTMAAAATACIARQLHRQHSPPPAFRAAALAMLGAGVMVSALPAGRWLCAACGLAFGGSSALFLESALGFAGALLLELAYGYKAKRL